MEPETPVCLRFRAPVVKDIMKKVLQEKLEGQDYQPDNVTNSTKEIADAIRDRLKGAPPAPLLAASAGGRLEASITG